MEDSMRESLIKKLVSIVHVDIDALQAYDQALKNIADDKEHEKVYNTLAGFAEDHREHIKNLSGWLKEMGKTPPDTSMGVGGFLLKSFTAIRGITGLKGTLAAMKNNEEITNKSYAEICQLNTEKGLQNLLKKNYEDEKRHLKYIVDTLKELKD